MATMGSTSSAASTFQKVIGEFVGVHVARSAEWPDFIRGFIAAFEVARKDRALDTPRLNILEVFGLKTWELCHSRVMAWFLEEKASHEQGGLFMECLLRHCGVSAGPCSGYTVQRERPGRVDVVAYQRRTFAIFIENKVNHHEEDTQFERLQRTLVDFGKEFEVPESHRVAIFLTDDGRRPTTAHAGALAGFQEKNLRPLRRLTLFRVFRDALAACEAKSAVLTLFLDAYINSISSLQESDL